MRPRAGTTICPRRGVQFIQIEIRVLRISAVVRCRLVSIFLWARLTIPRPRAHQSNGRFLILAILVRLALFGDGGSLGFPRFEVGMGVRDASRAEEHLEPDDDEGGYHGYYAGQWPVSLVEEPWETGVGEGDECGGEEMHEGGCNQHSCAEVL